MRDSWQVREQIVTSNLDTTEWIATFDYALLAQSAVDRYKNNAFDLVVERIPSPAAQDSLTALCLRLRLRCARSLFVREDNPHPMRCAGTCLGLPIP